MSVADSHAARPALRAPARLLPALLAVVAGMVDVTGFLDLGNIFTAHITGNLVVLAAAVVRGRPFNVAQALAIPVFMVTVAVVWLFARTAAARNAALRQRLLVAQSLLLAVVLVFSLVTHPSADPHGMAAGIAVLIAASAMACQNALLHVTVAGAPSTAVMTGNLVGAVLGLLDALSPDPATRRSAAARIRRFLPLLLGFCLGCIVAAAAVSRFADWAWALPTALAGLAAALRWTTVSRQQRASADAPSRAQPAGGEAR
jgi:uncharacterized membrane protein YoaK (UPF0700 family)